MENPLILAIKGNSLDDGPGIRSVVFFKGCPLSCVWCQNPEAKSTKLEISYETEECIRCDHCISICPKQALSRCNDYFIDRKRCDLCMKCVQECPAEALKQIGNKMDVNDIVREVRKDLPFFEISGGGVTLSGGEPTLFLSFLSCLLRELKRNGIHTLIETCGYFNLEKFMKYVYPYIDYIYYDIKLIDNHLHKRYCGVTNNAILRNYVKLNRFALAGGVPILARVPLVPGITATEKNLTAIADFLRQNSVYMVSLLPYNPLWIKKLNALGIPMSSLEPDLPVGWTKAEDLRNYQEIFHDFDFV